MTAVPPLTDAEYRWLMHHLRTAPPPPQQVAARARFGTLRARHRQLTAGRGRERTALHEAGHAVVCTALGCRVAYVLLRADDSGETPCIAPPRPRRDGSLEVACHQVERLRAYITIKAAGMVAEELGWRWARHPERGLVGEVAQQWRTLRPLVMGLEPSERAGLLPEPPTGHPLGVVLSLIAWGEQQAREVLRANWAATQTLATALIAHGRLEGTELTTLLASVVRTDNPEERVEIW